MKDSQKTQKLFDNSIEILDSILTSGEIENEKVANIAVKSLVSHLKAKNTEVKEATLLFMINRTILPNEEELKETLRKTLPEYAGELK